MKRKLFAVMDSNGVTKYSLRGTEIQAFSGVSVLYDVNTEEPGMPRYVKAVLFPNGTSVVEVADVSS